MDPCNTKIPRMMDLTGGDIAANTLTINSQTRINAFIALYNRYQVRQEVMEQLPEVNRSNIFPSAPVNGSCPCGKWQFSMGPQTRTDGVHPTIKPTILGFSTLVESINNPRHPANAREWSILGPFYTDDAHFTESGDSIASPNKGELRIVRCTHQDSPGSSMPDSGRAGSDSRDDLKINKHGELWFKYVKPILYSIMHDDAGGRTPGGAEQTSLPFRAHSHFKIGRREI
ncbi:hypothetical protein B9Z19DRAFT_1192993 [Tuber borchii]|uniref:Uncharacterized protein n=1 Tax=Tuber borchii TaxID=42251 RepID=A0A2T6ZTT4_TUBBO|nr:hypothetical protein B9Z19DRAFT_1192993 [Tuber borchii]